MYQEESRETSGEKGSALLHEERWRQGNYIISQHAWEKAYKLQALHKTVPINFIQK